MVPSGTVDSHQAYVKSLNPEEEQLIILRDFLYEGDWEDLLQDLRDRQSGKPFIFKLNTRIEEDLQRIEQLRMYERRNGVNLGRYIRPEELKRDLRRCASTDGSIDEEKGAWGSWLLSGANRGARAGRPPRTGSRNTNGRPGLIEPASQSLPTMSDPQIEDWGDR